MKRITQADRVMDYIHNFGSISRAEAMSDLGIANLPAVIDDLRHKRGVDIITDDIKATNRYGEKITYARYRLAESREKE